MPSKKDCVRGDVTNADLNFPTQTAGEDEMLTQYKTHMENKMPTGIYPGSINRQQRSREED